MSDYLQVNETLKLLSKYLPKARYVCQTIISMAYFADFEIQDEDDMEDLESWEQVLPMPGLMVSIYDGIDDFERVAVLRFVVYVRFSSDDYAMHLYRYHNALRQMNHVQQLFIGYWENFDALALMPLLRRQSNLRVLEIDLSNAGASNLSEVLNRSSLEELTIMYDSEGLSNSAYLKLGTNLKTNSRLKKLTCFNVSLSSASANFLLESIQFNQLEMVSLRRNHFDSSGVKSLKQGFGNLRTLDLGENFLGDLGALYLAKGLKTNEILEELNLPQCRIRDMGAIQILRAVSDHGELKKLSFRANQVTENAAAEISKFSKENEHLTRLDVAWNNISWAGACMINEAIGMNLALESLDLARNGYTYIENKDPRINLEFA